MTPSEIIKMATADGVKLTLSPGGTIKARGEHSAVERWVPSIRESKPAILALLAVSDEPTYAAQLAEVFYRHLWGVSAQTNCCYPRSGRYCPEGLRLKSAYYGACS